MAEQHDELTEVTFTRCPHCPQTVMTQHAPTRRLVHLENGDHAWRDWTPEAERPTTRTLALWNDVRAALEHVRLAEFLLGFHPEKPTSVDWEGVQLQLEDTRGVLGQLADALADGAGS